ncbi:MAG TPA: hypothetical protein VM120_08895 [Bryobacteraceae bacterium]|nr:hypothetical protein [Bryobacteraceae bacterium]
MPTYVPFLLRWGARLSTIFVAGTFALMISGELFSRQAAFPREFREWTGVSLLVLACAGMVLAWKHERSGAMLSLASLAAFGLLIPIRQTEVLMVAAVPGTLYLLDWAVRRSLGGPVTA